MSDFRLFNDSAIQSRICDADKLICNNILGEIDELKPPCRNDIAIIFYVAGYISHSIYKRNKCEFCHSMLVKNDKIPSILFDHGEWLCAKQLMNMLNRGGLCEPSETCFALCLLLWSIYNCITTVTYLKNCFLTATNHAHVFQKISQIYGNHLYDYTKKCSNGHYIFNGICFQFFNCLMKNFVNNFNGTARNSVVLKRRIQKLSSCVTTKRFRSEP